MWDTLVLNRGSLRVHIPSVFKIPRWFDRALVNVLSGAAHHPQVRQIAGLIWTRIAAIHPGKETIRCLDIRCGEMAIISTIAKAHSKVSWIGADTYPLPNYMRSSSLWSHYERFNGVQLGYKPQSFDIGIFSDVLHTLPLIKQLALLKEAARVCKVIIIKDHLEYGIVSHLVLMAMDFLGLHGNGYGLRVYGRYFNRRRFEALVREAGLDCRSMDVGIQLFPRWPLIRSVLRPKWQFIAVVASPGTALRSPR
jgi:2-polyprenyl-3-methyl-5-hydroxy-6-metoxy-1,4-benzoquinol methylase